MFLNMPSCLFSIFIDALINVWEYIINSGNNVITNMYINISIKKVLYWALLLRVSFLFYLCRLDKTTLHLCYFAHCW